METFSKDRHDLSKNDIEPKDKMNFDVPESQATAQYLVLMQRSLESLWYVMFFLQIWRSWILESEEYTLKENCITYNCYTCLELNGHALIVIIERLREIYKEELFLPWLFSSQVCKNFFGATSSDRSKRVKQNDTILRNIHKEKNDKSEHPFVEKEKIQIDEWVDFSKSDVGLVLGFSYLTGKGKVKEFPKETVPVKPPTKNARGIRVHTISDRSKRVKQNDTILRNIHKEKNDKSEHPFVEKEKIQIDEWVDFSKSDVGLVLGFSYLTGKGKVKEFPKETVPVKPPTKNARGIRVHTMLEKMTLEWPCLWTFQIGGTILLVFSCLLHRHDSDDDQEGIQVDNTCDDLENVFNVELFAKNENLFPIIGKSNEEHIWNTSNASVSVIVGKAKQDVSCFNGELVNF
ncbi:hypothetical protein FQA39_LY11774 [Lamprigera yunnana]|nr:hypothetical protein FQA39_LY11774 [Lamprigera yunnana]